ncbi:MAG: hypothetical protein R3C40_10315 [Parvularculaceae bacterium]
MDASTLTRDWVQQQVDEKSKTGLEPPETADSIARLESVAGIAAHLEVVRFINTGLLKQAQSNTLGLIS